jgi:ATP-dependent helicase/nuclease subunit A
MTAGRLLVGAFGTRRDDERLREADRAARKEAQRRFKQPLVLEAGAGTGKTTALIGRLLAWVLGAGWERVESDLAERAAEGHRVDRSPERVAAKVLRGVVAITFTEAAAAEMASRAAERLGALARGDEPPSWLDPAVLPPPEERTRRARALVATLDHLAIRTIHAFCRGLLADHPLEAGVHPELTIDAEGLLVEEVVQETVEAGLREGYGDPGDPDLIALAARGFGPREVADALTALVQAGLPPEVLEEDPFASERIEELRRRLIEAAEGVHDLVKAHLLPSTRLQNPKAIQRGLETLVARLLEEGPIALETIQAHAAELLPGNLVEHLRKWARGSLNATEKSLLGDVREELAARCSLLGRLLGHLEELDAELLGAARRALAPRLADVNRVLRTRGIATFDALLTGAERLLARHKEVRDRVRRGIDQLLVDEFQDTDRVQCEILRWIALDGPPEQRPGLFLVGDPKQSIYGWRSADLRAYDGFLERVRQGWGEVRPLVENFRSVPAILEEVARAIEPVMRERQGMQPRFEPLLPCDRRKDEPGFLKEDWAPVEHWVSWTEGGRAASLAEATELEAAAIATDLVALRGQGEKWKEMAILLRGMSQLDLYLEALRRAGVPFAVGRDKHYYRRREVIDAAALVRAVLDPGDHLALLTVLRSPTVGVPDAALIPLWNHDFPKLMTELSPGNLRAVADAIAKAAKELPRDVPALDRVRGWDETLLAAVEALAALRGSFASDPADVFLDKVRGLLLVDVTEAARYIGPYRLANLDRFFRQLLAAMEGAGDTGGDAATVLRALRRSVAEAREAEEGRPQDGSEDAVQVMTIHGAKGLDFKHVYLAQLHKESRGESGPKTEVGRVGDERWEVRLLGAPSLGFDAVEAERREVEAAERVRTLYVAMTRAKDRLVLAGAWPEDEAQRPPEQARHHLDLLLWRPLRPELAERWAEGAWSFPDRHGALWKLPALRPEGERGEAGAQETAVLPTPEEVAREAETLAARREEAEARRKRPFGGAASEEAHELLREQQSERRAGETVRVGRDAAMAAGGAVHRALETWDLFSGPQEEARRQRDLLPAYLARLAEGDVLDRSLPVAQSLLDHFAAGPLLVRLRELREHVLARELPVLLPPSGGAVGVISGTIDLLYRDPATGRLVVADYKTDAAESVDARVAVYAPQGATYVRALHEALGLDDPPRFELWFLQADRVV